MLLRKHKANFALVVIDLKHYAKSSSGWTKI